MTDLTRLDVNDPAWISFVQAHPHANIFHSPAWMRVLSQCYHFDGFALAALDEKGQVQAGLPVMQTRHSGTRPRWVALPFSDHCEPLLSPSFQRQEYIAMLGMQINQPPQPAMEIRADLAGNHHFWVQKEYVLHQLALQPSFQLTQARIHSMHRRNAQTAERRGVQVLFGRAAADMETYYHLHLMTRKRQGVPVQPRRFFNLLLQDVLQQDLGVILLAYVQKKCVAGAVFLHWNQTLTYKFGASDADYLQYRPNDLIFWQAIAWGCQNGFTRLDFGRTDLENSGLRQFKALWGAQETDLQVSYAPQFPKSRPAWQTGLAARLIRSSPAWVCRWLGEILYRYAA